MKRPNFGLPDRRDISARHPSVSEGERDGSEAPSTRPIAGAGARPCANTPWQISLPRQGSRGFSRAAGVITLRHPRCQQPAGAHPAREETPMNAPSKPPKPGKAGPSVTDQEALAFHSQGRPGKLEIIADQADGDAARPLARLFARRRGAGAGDRRGPVARLRLHRPAATSSPSSPTAPPSSASAISARSPRSR